MKKNYQINSKLSQTIFRTYDIRGVVGVDLTEDSVYTIGIAIGSEALARGAKKIIIGRDGRLSGPSLLAALNAGILATGCDTLNIGEVTTPVLYFATNILGIDSGVMLTGSHNPAEYNGIKMILAGKTIFGADIQELYKRITEENFEVGSGSTSTDNSPIESYIKRVLSDIKLNKPLKVVIDCGNGVGSKVAPQLFTALGCQVIPLFCTVDGRFPNHHPDPTVMENLKDLITKVKEEHADVGLAFDGDADRIGVITNKGTVIFPDRLIMYLAADILKRKLGSAIVYDVKATRNLEKEISRLGGKPILSPTGHSLVKAKMKETSAELAGELSGHVFYKDRWYGFDDGIYSAARFLELLSQDSRTSEEIFAALPNSISTPEIKIPISEEEKFSFMEKFVKNTQITDGKSVIIDGLRVDFPDGFGLIRASNTTPYLIARFEANDNITLHKIQDLFREKLLACKKDLKLPF